jgi:hypothetical protein
MHLLYQGINTRQTLGAGGMLLHGEANTLVIRASSDTLSPRHASKALNIYQVLFGHMDEGSDLLLDRLKPLYIEIYEIVHRNAGLELDVKELAASQMRLGLKYGKEDFTSDPDFIKLNERKAELIQDMSDNNLKIDRIRLSIFNLLPQDYFINKVFIQELEGIGKTSGIYALDFNRDQINYLDRLSKLIKLPENIEDLPQILRGWADPCWCQGCSSCTGCTTICQASCGNCIGCTGCTNCSGCGGACTACIGPALVHHKT